MNHLWRGILFCFDLISIKSKVSAHTMLLINGLIFFHTCLISPLVPPPSWAGGVLCLTFWLDFTLDISTQKPRSPGEWGSARSRVELALCAKGSTKPVRVCAIGLCNRLGSVARRRHWNPQSPSEKSEKRRHLCVLLSELSRAEHGVWSLLNAASRF